ncbi:ABC transporter permease [Wenyingzhuangia fucanilytica]|uniref:Transport permease protein n=1 Tax=Wenyingzhuangia fucanilytica TaxID=1790137 RepID=A0A1B1Y6C6_9FLAO|nr:ABC transporter permease [Wenyingzhuangia fucanilytica]ANW96315.1 ABC transporter permease [Wenyingzhuangia fucanilytica]
MNKNQNWLYEITPKNGLLDLNLKEVWRYRDLLFLFVKRDIVTVYKQTVLGPLWYLLEPLFTTVVFTLIFNNVANVSTGDTPSFLFNMSGIIVWGYFKSCLISTSTSFSSNAGIFSKVYFPRLIAPLTSITSNLFKFGIQLFIFSAFYVYYLLTGTNLHVKAIILLFPFMIILMGLLGLGLGLIISALVTKYRDMRILVNFGLQLLMYLSAVMYPISFFKEKMPEYSWIVEYNPLAGIIEMSRYLLFATDGYQFDIKLFITTIGLIFSLLFIGVIVFNRSEKNFIDTV